MKKLKTEKGSITLFVLIAMMFFLMVLLLLYANSSNKLVSQKVELEKIQTQYASSDLDQIYDETIKNTDMQILIVVYKLSGEVYSVDEWINQSLKLKIYYPDDVKEENRYYYKDNVKIKYNENQIIESNCTISAEYKEKRKELKISRIDKIAPSVTMSPNGGTYTMPTAGNATIKSTLNAVDTGGSGLNVSQYAWNTSNTVEPTTWTNFTNAGTVSKTDCTQGTYYLWTKVTDKAENRASSTKVSNEFIVKANTDLGSQITITLSTTNWTNQNITATITYGSTLTSNKKAGYGASVSEAESKAQGSTATSVVVTANGYVYAEGTDEAGNKIVKTIQITNMERIEPTVTITPNGGTYTMPTSGNATIKSTLTASDTGGSGLNVSQYAWSINNTTEPTSWTNFTNGVEISKTDCTQGTYYLWTRVVDKAGNRASSIKVSNGFVVKANTDTTSLITITPNTTAWTNQNITATVSYGSLLTANKKAGYGATVANAQTAANTITQAIVSVTDNGYVYAEATDSAGNKITKSLQITNIERIAPTVTATPNGGTYTMPTSGNATIKSTLTASDTGGSGLNISQYAWSTSNTTEPSSWTNFTNGVEISKTDCAQGTYYLWTKVVDKAGNRASSIKVSNGFVVKANTDTTSLITITPNTTSWTNQNITATITYGSTLIANKKAGYGTTVAEAQSAANTASATSVNVTDNGYVYAEATDSAGNKIIKTLTISNIDKILPIVTVMPNGGTYTMPTTGNATIKTILNATDTGESGLNASQYAWNTSNTVEPTTWTNFTNGVEISKTDCTAGTYYLWTKVTDKAGNRSSSVKVSSGFIVKANTDSTAIITITPNTTAWTNQNVTATIAYGSTLTANKKAGYGTTVASAQTAANTATQASVNVTNNGYVYAEATDSAGNKITKSLQITNIDKILPIVTVAPNGGTYTIKPGNTTVPVSITIDATDTGGSDLKALQYQLSTVTSIPNDNDASWKNFTNHTDITENLTGGTYYLYTKVIDQAGNRATNLQKSSAFIINYQVIYDANGGTGAPVSQIKTQGTNLTLSTVQPTRSNYMFLGWSTTSAGSVVYQSGASYSNNAAITLYAQWMGITAEPKAVTVKQGNQVNFSITAYNAATYQWYQANNGTEAGTAIAGATSANYSIVAGNVTSNLNGKYYYCVIKNGTRSITSNKALLIVYYPPTITAQATTQTLRTGNQKAFSVSLTAGNPAAMTYQWYKAVNNTTAGTAITGATAASYTISSLTEEHSGSYYLIVNNGQYSITSNRFFIDVNSLGTVKAGQVATEDSSLTGKHATASNPVVPKGFKPLDTVNAVWGSSVGYQNGLVIEDATGAATNTSQFVWIPVENYANFIKKDGYYDGAMQGYVGNCKEADLGSSYATSESQAMHNSVKKNGGFYIARYEAGIASGMSVPSSDTTSYATGSYKPVSKVNVAPWTFIAWGAGTGANDKLNGNDNSNGAAKAARGMYTGTTATTAKSTLTYGVQWDAMMTFLNSVNNTNVSSTTLFTQNSKGMGRYLTITSANTGLFMTKNIYDIAGNVYEWTMESYNNKERVFRGGYYYDDGEKRPVSIRCLGVPEGYGGNVGFRVSLYV